MTDRPFLVIGGGGHAKSVIFALLAAGEAVAGYVDSATEHMGHDILGAPLLGDDSLLPSWIAENRPLAIGLGLVAARKRIFEHWTARGADFPPIVHPQSIVCPSTKLSSGVQILAGAIVQPAVTLEANVLLNTGSKVDHDCIVGAHSTVGPGAVLCGNVAIGAEVQIGASATIIQSVAVGAGAQLGAGAVLLEDLAPSARAAGVPARAIGS